MVMGNSATCSKWAQLEQLRPSFVMKLKILQLAPLYKPLTPGIGYGSIERIVIGLDSGFTKAGFDSYVCALNGSKISGTLLESLGINNYETQAEIALDFLKKRDVDIVHIHRRNFLQTRAFEFCKTKNINIPVLYTLHGLAKDLIKKFDFSINIFDLDNLFFNAVSRYQAKNLSNLFPIKEVVHNGVDIALYNYVDNQTRDYFLSIGRLNREKGTHIAIQFAKKTKIPLIIAGNIVDKDYFESDIRPYIDNENVKFLGELTDQEKIPLFQHAIAVLMMGEYNDPCPLVAIEALSCGTPVIAFKRGGIPEIVQDGITGLLLDSLDDGLKKITGLAKINNEECRKRIEQEFSLNQMAEKYFVLYSKLIEKMKRGI